MSAIVIEKYVIENLPTPMVITSEAQNEYYTEVLLELERRPRLTSKQRAYAELLTVLIESYEEEHYPIHAASPAQVLQELVTANNLRQKDLAPLLGTESIVSEVLSGKRPLTKQHIEKLSERFNVSPAVFF